MFEINNSKRLIAKYAREERLDFERNLKEKGLWTQAQERRSLRQPRRSDYELYERLENNFAAIEAAENAEMFKNFDMRE